MKTEEDKKIKKNVEETKTDKIVKKSTYTKKKKIRKNRK